MTDEAPNWPRPADYKTRVDGSGGLVRAVLVGPPHEGRELFMDELELPDELYTTPDPAEFEWWPGNLNELMDRLPIGSDPTAAPVRHVLRIADDTREPQYVSEPAD